MEFVIECGLVYMLENNMLPFKEMDDPATFQPNIGETQH